MSRLATVLVFKQTGVHPEMASREEHAAAEKPDLPEVDAERPFVFMDLAVGSKPLGTIVIEVFQDLAPSAAREFTLRITGGGAGRAGFVAYERTLIHKIVDGVRLEGGRAGNGKGGGGGGGGGVPVEESRRLCHSSAGVVSLSPTSSEFTITAGPAHHLDGEQQVVGRVVRGMEHVEKLSEAEVDEFEFTPLERVMVTACGMTSSAGGGDAPGGALQVAAELRAARAAADAEREARERGETKAETKARLERESHELGASLKRSLADGLKNKTAAADVNKKARTAGGGKGMMAAMLGDIPSSDDDDDSSDDEA